MADEPVVTGLYIPNTDNSGYKDPFFNRTLASHSPPSSLTYSYLSHDTGWPSYYNGPLADFRGGGAEDILDLPPPQLKNLVRGIIWRDEHFGGLTIRQIAEREYLSEGYVGKLIFESFESLRQ